VGIASPRPAVSIRESTSSLPVADRSSVRHEESWPQSVITGWADALCECSVQEAIGITTRTSSRLARNTKETSSSKEPSSVMSGNSGDAVGTPTHLHYGIYHFRGGAVNPYQFITTRSGLAFSPQLDDSKEIAHGDQARSQRTARRR